MFKIIHDSMIGGDIFNAKEEVKVITTNSVGAMGKGIALSTKQRYPAVYQLYYNRHRNGTLVPDEVIMVTVPDSTLALFPTKVHWRDPAVIEIIESNIVELHRELLLLGLETVAIPPLGLVNGWLRGDDVLRRITVALRDTFLESPISAVWYLPDKLYNQVRRL